jgi:hypothetical protein
MEGTSWRCTEREVSMRNQIAQIFVFSLAAVLGWMKPAAAGEDPKYNVIIILAE